jgi:hypothetical protein
MKKRIYILGIFLTSGLALLLAQSNSVVRDTSWHSRDTHGDFYRPYDMKNPPAINLSDAYALALNNLSSDTNQFYCSSATCIGNFPIVSTSNINGVQGWAFIFSNTNGVQRKILVGYNKMPYVLRY